MMTIKQFRNQNPEFLNNFVDDYFSNFHPTPEGIAPEPENIVLKEIFKYFLNTYWLPTFDNFEMLVDESVFMNHFLSVLSNLAPSLVLSLRQHKILTSNIYMDVKDLVLENTNKNIVSTSYSGFGAKGEFANVETNNTAVLDNKLSFLINMNSDIKEISKQLDIEIEKYLVSFYAI